MFYSDSDVFTLTEWHEASMYFFRSNMNDTLPENVKLYLSVFIEPIPVGLVQPYMKTYVELNLI